MNFDITELLDKGLSMLISVAAIYAVFSFGRLVTKYIPSILEAARDFIKAWDSFSDSMIINAAAIDKNTIITDTNHKHSEIVLAELKLVGADFKAHDSNAMEIKELIYELTALFKEENDSDEILRLLRLIVDKLEEADEL